ncbi:MAG: hypothetical protein HQK88_00280 [Nitrospirae bacterium]|nr:hypothetical protein [Nitrospirota bacterium]MBF0615234.1 hypothetical protein [Nitrospirota bacterium]
MDSDNSAKDRAIPMVEELLKRESSYCQKKPEDRSCEELIIMLIQADISKRVYANYEPRLKKWMTHLDKNLTRYLVKHF